MYLSSSQGEYSVAVMPKADNDIDFTQTELKFSAIADDEGNRIAVGLIMSPDNLHYFDTVATITPGTSDWEDYKVSLKNNKGTNRYIAFMVKKRSDVVSNSVYIDNVVLDQREDEEVDLSGQIHLQSDSLIAWISGIEVNRYSTVTDGNYYDALHEADASKFVSLYKGYATATFDSPVRDADGYDFAVFGNKYTLGQAYVEVSSDGTHFFRFNDKTELIYNDWGKMYDLNDLDDNAYLDKQNIRFIRITDDSTSGYCLEGIGIINAGEEYVIADMEGLIQNGSGNNYELPSASNYDYVAQDGSYYKDYESGSLVFPGVSIILGNFDMAIGWGLSDITDANAATPTSQSGTGYDNEYYTSSALAAADGKGNTYLHGYYSPWNSEEHLAVYSQNNETFYPNGVYVSQSLSCYNFARSDFQYDLYYKVVATGYDKADRVTTSQEIDLINRNNPAVGSIAGWRFMDLTSLGEVKKVKFEVKTNDTTYYIPYFFCIDHFTYKEGSPIVFDTVDQTICENETFMGQNQSGKYIIGDTVLNLNVTPLNRVTMDTAVCAGTVFEFNGKQYLSSVNFIDTVEAENGCDTVYTVNLTVKDTSKEEISVNVYETDLPYTFGDLVLNETCDTFIVLESSLGCDSTIYLHLNVIEEGFELVQTDTAVCFGSVFEFNGKQYLTTQSITDTVYTSEHTGTIYMIDLTVKEKNETYDTAEVYSKELPYTFGSLVLYASCDTVEVFEAADKCDSVVYLHLNVIKESVIEVNIDTVLCAEDVFLYKDKEYYDAQTITDTVITAKGCDTVTVINLQFREKLFSYDTVTVKHNQVPYSYKELLLDSSCDTVYNATSVFGCDSNVYIHFTVETKPVIDSAFDTIICFESVFEFNNKEYNSSQTIIDTVTESDDTDTIYTINLTVREQIVQYDTVNMLADDLPYIFGGLSLYEACDTSYIFESQDGCDSLVYLHLNVESGLNGAEGTEHCNIYPNPAKDKVTITSEGDVTVINSKGQIVKEIKDTKGVKDIAVKDLESGVYYIKAGKFTHKLIIEK